MKYIRMFATYLRIPLNIFDYQKMYSDIIEKIRSNTHKNTFEYNKIDSNVRIVHSNTIKYYSNIIQYIRIS